jgi:hypothetical protein
MSNADLAWISDLSDRNLLGLIDVLADMRDELETGVADPQIRIIPSALRFPQLHPEQSIPNTDNYGRLRWSVANLLQQNGILATVEVVGTEHRWKQRIAFQGDLSQVVLALQVAEKEKLRRPGLALRPRKFLDRRILIALLIGGVVATAGWLALDYAIPNESRHIIEATFLGLVGAAVILVAWPIIQSTIGSAIWDWIASRRQRK